VSLPTWRTITDVRHLLGMIEDVPRVKVPDRKWQVFGAIGGIGTNDLAADTGWTPTIDQAKKKIFLGKD